MFGAITDVDAVFLPKKLVDNAIGMFCPTNDHNSCDSGAVFGDIVKQQNITN